MVRKSNAILALLMLCAAVAWVGLVGIAGAAYPVARAALRGQPVITDPYHHISGVIAVPPEEMMGEHPTPPWAGPLTPPVFGPNVDASLNNAANQNETTIAINPENDQTVISAANDYRVGLKPWVYYSTDGGTSWVNYQVPGTVPSFNYGDPAMAYGTGSAAYFTYLGYTSICGGQGGMYASRSTDAGATFSAPIQLGSNSNNGAVAVLQDKEYVAVDNNPSSAHYQNVYVGWTQYSFVAGTGCGTANSQIAAPAVLSRSTDEGLTWTVPITASPPISSNNGGVVPAVGLNGEVYLYYVGAAEQSQLFYDSILFSRSTDGGQTFPHFRHISNVVDLPSPLPPTNFRNNPFGAIAADQQIPGYIYAVWADYRTGDADILFSRTTDNGDTWGPPQRVNDDPVGNQKDQFFPWIATSPDGGIHITWFDRREASDNRNYKAYYTTSTDHGLTFEPNVAVSDAPSVPGSSNFIGDYSGIAATDGVVMPSWTDIRAGTNQNDYVARGIFTPQATVTPQPSATSTATNTPLATDTPVATNTPAITSTATQVASSTPTACTVSFTDVPPSNTFYANIRCLACRGILGGYSDGTFRPNNDITRGQIAKVVSNAAGFNESPGAQIYEDVPASNTFYAWINRLSMRGHMGGYPCGTVPTEPCGTDNKPYFRPNANATRGQLAKIVASAAQITGTPTGQRYADVPEDSTFYAWIEQLSSLGVMGGYSCGSVPNEPCDDQNRPYFRPSNNVTRGQASKIVANTFFPGCQTPASKK
jgi:hypothetical protein